jgi:hypothetical protein
MTWTLVNGHKWPVKGLCASGPQGPDPSSFSYSGLNDSGYNTLGYADDIAILVSRKFPILSQSFYRKP